MQGTGGGISPKPTTSETQMETQHSPKIARITPAADKEASPNAKIFIQFSEAMSESTVEQIEVTKNGWKGGPTTGETIPGKWSSPDGKGFTFTPTQPLVPGSLVVIRPTGSVQSKTGAALNPDKPIYSFLVDDGHRHGSKEIAIASLKKTNNGTHNIPMHITLPDGDGPFPVMFWVHGGGWQGGTAEASAGEVGLEVSYLADHLGVAVVGVSYRTLGSKGTFTEAIEDVTDAIKYVQDHAADYHIDSQHIGLYGGSAGTPLAALVAQRTPTADLFVGYNGIYDFVHVKNGMFGSGNAYKQQVPSASANSAIDHIRKNPPATLLLHGTKDTTIDPQQSIAFAKAIQAAGGKANVLLYEGEEHAFFNPPKTMELPTLFEVKEFIREVWGLK